MGARTSLPEVLDDALALLQAQIHTALPARVVAVNGALVDVQPVIQAIVNDTPVTLPVFPGVPIYWPGSANSYTAHPVAPGDYCLLVVSERCIDGWWNGQDEVPPVEERLHDYSDAFALCGIRRSGAGVTIPDHPTMAGTQVHLGEPAPADAAAVGSKVLSELQALRNTVDAMVTAFNSHTHPTAPAGPVSTPSTVQVAPAAVGPVASTVVKIPGGVA